MDAVDEFRRAIAEAGITPPDEIIADGKLHRFSTNGQRGDDAGWYVLYSDGTPAGAFGDWRSGKTGKWYGGSRKLSPAERAQARERIAEARKAAAAERARRADAAAQEAEKIWETATPAETHPYLADKGVGAHGVRVRDGDLLVPMRDAEERLRSVQRIAADGGKRFPRGAAVRGLCHLIGKPDGVVCVAEGYATAAAIHEATGHAVAVAFSANNLEPVAQALREKRPEVEILIAGDNDESGTGQREAEKAARAVGGKYAIPEDAGDDWCDVRQRDGDEAVRAGLSGARHATKPEQEPCDEMVEVVPASEIKPEPVGWLWPGWLAAGKLHIIAGAPGTGKTTIALSLAATVSTGGKWPDGSRCEAGSVLIWSGEDGVADTLVPRLTAMKANLERVHFIENTLTEGVPRPFDPAHDIPALSKQIAKLGDVRLLIVDPVVSAVAADSHKNSETRRALQPLVDLARECNTAVLGISHFAKGSRGRDPVERVVGSLAFGALARIVLGTAKNAAPDADAERLLVRAKSNLGPDGGGYAYDLKPCEVTPGVTATHVRWVAPLEGTARDILETAEMPESEGGDRTEADEAVEFLMEVLDDGPLPVSEVKAQAQAAGIGDKALRRARERLGIKPRKSGFTGGWVWGPPSKMPSERNDAIEVIEI